MGGLNLVGLSQCHHQAVQAPGETVDIEIQRIVVAIGDLRVDRGMDAGTSQRYIGTACLVMTPVPMAPRYATVKVATDDHNKVFGMIGAAKAVPPSKPKPPPPRPPRPPPPPPAA